VLFLGVLYHLRHPLLALDLLHEHVTRDLLVFQSLLRGSSQVRQVQEDYEFGDRTVFERPDWPRLSFVEHRYAGDPTNWWVPNRACAEAMLRSSGYQVLDHPEEEVFVCRHRELSEHESGERGVYSGVPSATSVASETGSPRRTDPTRAPDAQGGGGSGARR
jgi:tRNA (mo5U34)-methyltransferase